MSTNTGLIARLREGQTYDFNTGLPNDMSCPMDDAADAIEALEAEVANLKRKNTVTQGIAGNAQAERDALQAQLAAAQGQAQQYDEALCTVAEQRDTMKLRIRQHLANRYAYTFKEFCENLEEILYAAPIPQQAPSVPEGWKLVPVEATPEMISAGAVHHYGACSRQDRSDADKAWDAMLAAAPQPKDTK